ncbi:TPA: nuclear transport factor 2 family protein [Burkholderia orbicola]|uniref:nuclear transport factor 2 family protein n=1 Tax=Burkholderia cepacia complex TaxID=87882 RepID=UPI002011603E|nr:MULTISPECIES: nuclear transport factor 2 family protein [Burkholderia cepacia complex]MDN7556468.1 nuclear transport factor 2 family protein [Burkholderia orbicola]
MKAHSENADMTLLLPDPIHAYFEFSNGADKRRAAYCFTPDAVVVDEGRTHRGHDAIKSWKRASREQFEFAVEPVAVSRDGDRVTVRARVDGNFLASPVQLDHVFDLAGDQIRSLEIH